REGEGEGLITRACSKLFYFLMNIMTDVSFPAEADVFLTDRLVINTLKNTPEKNSEICLLIAWLGFSQTNIAYTQEPRYSGRSKWTLSKQLKLFFDSLISFSYAPLRFMSIMGSILASIGLIYGVDILISYLLGNTPISGWASLMIVVLIIGGFQMCMMGMLGEYLWRTYDETRGRPKYVIEKNTLLESERVKGSEKTS
ncbi:MAG: glycosyltransferase, partial [Proteobacteria bacterium]|nr:glycosyltransferase [Pseudomonadota bacterium]